MDTPKDKGPSAARRLEETCPQGPEDARATQEGWRVAVVAAATGEGAGEDGRSGGDDGGPMAVAGPNPTGYEALEGGELGGQEPWQEEGPGAGPVVGAENPQLLREQPQQPQQPSGRMLFTQVQRWMLEHVFLCNPYPKAWHRNWLARFMNVSTPRVQIWFKNRRAKWRRIQRETVLRNLHQNAMSLPIVTVSNQYHDAAGCLEPARRQDFPMPPPRVAPPSMPPPRVPFPRVPLPLVPLPLMPFPRMPPHCVLPPHMLPPHMPPPYMPPPYMLPPHMPPPYMPPPYMLPPHMPPPHMLPPHMPPPFMFHWPYPRVPPFYLNAPLYNPASFGLARTRPN